MAKTFTKPQVQEVVALEAVLTAASVIDDATPTNVVALKCRNKNTGVVEDYVVGDEGAQLSDLQVAPVDTRAADIAVHLYVSLDGGTTMRYRGYATVATQAISATVAPKPAAFKVGEKVVSIDEPLALPRGAKVYVGAATAVPAGLVVTGVSREYAAVALAA